MGSLTGFIRLTIFRGCFSFALFGAADTQQCLRLQPIRTPVLYPLYVRGFSSATVWSTQDNDSHCRQPGSLNSIHFCLCCSNSKRGWSLHVFNGSCSFCFWITHGGAPGTMVLGTLWGLLLGLSPVSSGQPVLPTPTVLWTPFVFLCLVFFSLPTFMELLFPLWLCP